MLALIFWQLQSTRYSKIKQHMSRFNDIIRIAATSKNTGISIRYEYGVIYVIFSISKE